MTIEEDLATLIERLNGHMVLDEYRHDQIDRQTDKASSVLDDRLEGMNQFRQQLEKQSGTFLTREEYQSRHDDLDKRIQVMNTQITSLTGARTGAIAVWGFVVAALGVIALIVSFVLKAK